jgi:hypothetical protein
MIARVLEAEDNHQFIETGSSSVLKRSFSPPGELKMRSRICVEVILLLSLCGANANAQLYRILQYASPGEQMGNTLVKADLNHDGKPDVVGLSNQQTQSGYITAVLADGKGGFLAYHAFSSELKNLTTLAVGDFNADGFPDVVVTGVDSITGAAAVEVMLGLGDGTFQDATVYDYATAGSLGRSVTGDFNGDGKIDVAVLGTTNTVAVFPGKGDGSLGLPIVTTTTASLASSCVAAADFNNDGNLDLTIGTRVLLGKGNGHFQQPNNVPDGNCGVAIADFNHDGFLDLVTGSLNFEDIRVHLGNGTGKFDAGTTYFTGHTAGATLRIADFNDDGVPDIAVLNGGDSDITILMNQGAGVFNIGKTWNCGPTCSTFLVGDFGQDKTLDMVVPLVGHLGLIVGSGKGMFHDGIAYNDQIVASATTGTFIAADVNNDHKTDLVFNSVIELGNGDGSFQTAIPFPSGCNATTVGDFNHDGKLDIAGPGANSLGVAVCLGMGDGTFGNPVVYDQGIQHELVLAGDFNNDGKLDLCASDQNGVSVLFGKGNGKFQSAYPPGSVALSLRSYLATSTRMAILIWLLVTSYGLARARAHSCMALACRSEVHTWLPWT